MNHTTPPKPSPEQIAQARGVVKESLTTPEESSVVEAPSGDPIRTALKRLVKLDDAHEGDRQWEPWLNAIAAARAVLASTPPDGHLRDATEMAPPPAEGEVASLAGLSPDVPERLRHCPTHGQQPANAWGCPECVRELRQQAAELERQSAPVPVAVSERLPEAEDCDAEERCWLLVPRWILPPPELTHWLPYSALPLPSGEATNG